MKIEIVQVCSGFYNKPDTLMLSINYHKNKSLCSRPGSGADKFFAIDIPDAELAENSWGETRIFVGSDCLEPVRVLRDKIQLYNHADKSTSNYPIIESW